MIPFGEWTPDFGDLNNPGATEAKNVIPIVDGYDQFSSLASNTNALTAYCRGAFSAKNNASNSFNYAGDETKLYQLETNAWADQSVGGGYSLGADSFWEFVKWGEKIIAAGGPGVTLQIITMGSVAGTQFATIVASTGTVPEPRHIAVVRDFVVTGNNEEGGTVYPNRLRWSGINDETAWGTDVSSQADFQDLQGDGGWIQAIRGGQYGVIIQEKSIWRMDYTGPPYIFSLDERIPGIGTPAPKAAVRWGDVIYMPTQDGFARVVNGAVAEPIADNKFARWFYDNVDTFYINRTVGAIDKVNKRVVWIFPKTGSSDGLPNAGIVYDIRSNRGSYFEQEIEWLYDGTGEGYTLEQLDSVSASIDALGDSLDSRRWIGGALTLSGFDSAHKSGDFNGAPLTAIIDTTEQRLSRNRTFISRIRPEIDGGSTVTVSVGARDSQEDSVAWTDATAERDDAYTVRSDARFHRFRATIEGGFERAHGITVVEGEESGAY